MVTAGGLSFAWGLILAEDMRELQTFLTVMMTLLGVLITLAELSFLFLAYILPAILGTALAVRKGYSSAWLCFATVPLAGWLVCLILWRARPRLGSPGHPLICPRCNTLICPKCNMPVSDAPPPPPAPPARSE